jgi:hypothetical protein
MSDLSCKFKCLVHVLAVKCSYGKADDGGGGEIRTHEGCKPLPVFKTGALNHSATPPLSMTAPLPLPFCRGYRRKATSTQPRIIGRNTAQARHPGGARFHDLDVAQVLGDQVPHRQAAPDISAHGRPARDLVRAIR